MPIEIFDLEDTFRLLKGDLEEVSQTHASFSSSDSAKLATTLNDMQQHINRLGLSVTDTFDQMTVAQRMEALKRAIDVAEDAAPVVELETQKTIQKTLHFMRERLTPFVY